MLFNSIEFLIFLPLSFVIFWVVFPKHNAQNVFILFVSYVFYGFWDWRFLILIAFTSLISYLSGILIEKYNINERKQKYILATNIILNLLILGVFKYCNFFIENLLLSFLWEFIQKFLEVMSLFVDIHVTACDLGVLQNTLNEL